MLWKWPPLTLIQEMKGSGDQGRKKDTGLMEVRWREYS